MKSAEEVLSEEFDNKGLGEPDRELTSKPYSAILSAMQTYANQSKWISVEERLPEKEAFGQSAWYTVACNGMILNQHYFYDYEHGKWINETGGYTTQITHWQPLPAPPNKE